MKIYFLTSKLDFKSSGGSIEEIDLIIKTLQKLGNEVTVITLFSHRNNFVAPPPYQIIEENISASNFFKMQWDIFCLLKKYSNSADFFHVDAHLCLYGAGLYKKSGGKVPIVALFNQFLSCFSPHTSSFFIQPKKNLITLLKMRTRRFVEKNFFIPIANKIDIFYFVSPMLKIMYEKFGIRKSERDMVVADLVNFKKIMQENNILEDSYRKRNKKDKPIILFYSSRMSSGKGFDVLLTAFSKLVKKDDYYLILGGSGPEQPLVQKMVYDFNLENFVYLPGWVSKKQLYAFYKKADIFIQADWWPAGTSISLLYAMAFGVPSILPGGGGLQWNAKDGALYFEYRNSNDLANKIELLGNNYDLRAELSRNCYKRIFEEEMDYEKNILNLYEAMKKTLVK